MLHEIHSKEILHNSAFTTSFNIGRPLNTPSLTGGVLAFFGGVPTACPSPAPRFAPFTTIRGGANVGCILSAPSPNVNNHPRPSINAKNSAINAVAPSVRRDPTITSLDRARVNDTLTRRQSLSKSPTWTAEMRHTRAHRPTSHTHLSVIVGAHHRNDHAVLVPPLTLVRRQNLDLALVLQEMGEELDLLTVE